VKTEAGRDTINEILSEPQVWRQCLDELDRAKTLEAINRKFPGEVEYVFIGCGSSFYLAQAAAATWSLTTRSGARALPASEIVLFPKLLPVGCQPVLISRSGFTSEVLEAAEYFEQRRGMRTLAVTCGSNTPLEKIAASTICLPAADERSTVMTRSYTSMLLALQSLAGLRVRDAGLLRALRELPEKTEAILPMVKRIVRSLVDSRSFADYVFLGQGPFYGVAQEAMLKVKEMSCSYAQCFHTLEFRHGPKSIVGPETLISFFLSDSGSEAEIGVLAEVKDLGGTTLVIADQANSAVQRAADYLIELSLEIPEAARAAAMVVPGQLLGFYTGVRKGLNPDEPRNLTRVVLLGGNKDGGLPGAAT
jgi:glucosamine--fructose-6-phosphate aminotransferase (isomerizing)